MSAPPALSDAETLTPRSSSESQPFDVGDSNLNLFTITISVNYIDDEL